MPRRMTKQEHQKALNRGEAPIQMSFFTPDADWKPRDVSSLPSWAGIERIGIDCETKDSQLRELGPGPRRGGYTIGWALALEAEGRIVDKFYLPIRHEAGGNLPVEEVLRYMRSNAKDFTGEYVGANLSYDLDYATNDEIEFHPEARFRDIQIADPLIYELHRSYSLASIGERWGVKGKETEVLYNAARSFGLDPGAGMWRLHSKYVGEYAENDVTSPLEIYAKQRQVIDRDELWTVFDMETAALPVLVRMRQRGVRIDVDKLDQIKRKAFEQESSALDLVYRETGVRIGVGDVWKAGALAPALESIGVKLGRTSTGAPQIDADLLENLDHKVSDAIYMARKVNKIRTTFASSMEKYMVNGRIHCTFNQIAREDEKGDQKGARYGRLSAVDPNLQQQYSPDRVGPKDPALIKEWREIFIPEEGAIWGCNDYSQQEPRWTTHFAAVMDLPRAQEAAQRYRDEPTTDNHDMMTRLIHGDELVDEWLATDPKGDYKINRGYSKNIFLGLCYGEGGAKLCRDIGKETRWAVFVGWGDRRQTHYFDTRQEAWGKRAELGDGYVKEVAGVEGQIILDGFSEEVPYVPKLAKEAEKRAKSVGFVRTILGRRLHFDQRDDGTYDWTHKALNRVIQGTSADQTKVAIVELDRAGYFLQLQVHDETDGSYGSVAEAKGAGEVMRDCILSYAQPEVPFNVDTECGPSWGEIKGV